MIHMELQAPYCHFGKWAFKHETKREREEISQEKPPERLTLLRQEHAANLMSCTETNSGLKSEGKAS